MKKLAFYLLFILPCLSLQAQKGYPERTGIKDLPIKFQNPPEGYGEVPFYWWEADTLTKERLTWQLDMLKQKKITSLQVNFSHTDEPIGHLWGPSQKSIPAQFSDKWWEIFGWFMQESNKRGMTVSVSDYTLGLGQGYAFDEVCDLHPDIRASKLVFEHFEVNDGKFSTNLKDSLISIVAFNKQDVSRKIDLTPLVKDRHLDWSNKEAAWTIVATYSQIQPYSYNPMHPLAGKEYVRCFFQRFEDKFPGQTKGKLNYFFSDELNFQLDGIVWDERFADEFKSRKGYDIRPLLAGLNMDIGPITTKIRLDYNDVFTELSEKNFFVPVYQWHADRQLIFGCDHGGRGLEVDEFGDYFRTQRWNQGPGSDQPRLEKNIVKAKVASSISHLYDRPRVWLEGFHSSGWGTTSAALMDAIYANFAMGYNLLSLHGLYYATPGGLWEWAPPCNHFRMPYWETMDKTLSVTERLSYILSQGYHQCDVAILYPVEPKVAGYGNTSAELSFKIGEDLYKQGIDFDYMDYGSLQQAQIENDELIIAHNHYKAVIIPAMSAIRDSSLRKLGEFSQHGGLVINVGSLPECTEVQGKDAIYMAPLLQDLTSGNAFYNIAETAKIKPLLDKHYSRDFRIMQGFAQQPYIHHRKIDNRDIYGVYNVEKGTKCFFRATGDVEFWDVLNGKRYKLSHTQAIDRGTIVEMPKEKSAFQLIVFTPHSDAPVTWKYLKDIQRINLANQWESEIIPILDNRFGDFHYPATSSKLLPEVRHYHYLLSDQKKINASPAAIASWKDVVYTYGDEFVCSGATSKELTDDELSKITSAPTDWKPYSLSRKWGVFDDAGHQGWHGSKMRMNPEVIRLGKLERKWTHTTRIDEAEGKNYYLFTTVQAPYTGNYKVLMGNDKPSRCFVNGQKVTSLKEISLKKGINTLILCYNQPVITYFFLKDKQKESPKPLPLTLQWYNDNSILAFDPYPQKYTYGWYAFQSAPGLESFEVGIHGEATCWINGEKVPVVNTNGTCTVQLPQKIKESANVVFRVKSPFGVKGGNALTTELVQHTGKGLIESGDWGKIDGLHNFSGGIKYTQHLRFTSDQLTGKTITLKLSSLSAAAELSVNGRVVDKDICPDWTFDITDFVCEGENEISLTVYNTAYNHYETLPTPYKEYTPSGILGSAWIEICK